MFFIVTLEEIVACMDCMLTPGGLLCLTLSSPFLHPPSHIFFFFFKLGKLIDFNVNYCIFKLSLTISYVPPARVRSYVCEGTSHALYMPCVFSNIQFIDTL